MQIISNCTGHALQGDFHASSSDARSFVTEERDSALILALVKHGNPVSIKLTPKNREYIQTAVDPELLRLFGYRLRIDNQSAIHDMF